MAELVNLRRERKRRRRADAEVNAAENRILHGRSKADRAGMDRLRAADERRLEGHRRQPPGPQDGDPVLE
jgi:uncharacterized membrane-anchored protein